MKRFKGTKGKWISNFSAVNSGNIQIADVYCRKECSVAEFTKDDWKEAYANAQLMATAPELLEALKGLLAIVNESEGVHGYHLNGDTAYWSEFEEIRFAEMVINKALGDE